MDTQYWVIGADYRATDFTVVVEGTLQVSGPYADHAEATQAWRTQSEAHRHKALTRFTIASSASSALTQ